MDRATVVALRAIVSALRDSGAISAQHVAKMAENLASADQAEALRIGTAERCMLRRLCMQIAADAGVESPIKQEDPPMSF